jgi:hypothetical protein
MYVFVLIFAMYPLTMTIGEYFGNMFFFGATGPSGIRVTLVKAFF